MIVRVVKEWDYPDLLRQTPRGDGVWDGVRFTLEQVNECDYLIILNAPNRDIQVTCAPENIWTLIQEPYIEGVFDWVVEVHDQFSRVLSHHPLRGAAKYHAAPPLVPWHVNRSYSELQNMPVPEKIRDLSWITSNLNLFPGHRLRMKFLDAVLSSERPEIEIFGRGIHPIDDKWDGLAPYRRPKKS